MIRWLHFSDLHFNCSGYDTANLQNKLIKKLKELNINLDFLLITGDLMYKYSADNLQLDQMTDFIKDIRKTVHCQKNKIFICQGNHDVNRYDNKRNNLIEDIRKGKKLFSDNYSELCNLGNEKFERIHKDITGLNYKSYNVIEPKGESFRIISLNTTLLSKDKKDENQLQICNEQLLSLNKKLKMTRKLIF